MIEDLRKSFNAYAKQPFMFAWGSLMYIVLLVAFVFACAGIVVAYFIALSVFGQQFSLGSVATLGVLMITAAMFLFFSNGLNAALAFAYRGGLWKEKTSLTKFYSYAIDKAPPMFIIMLMRDIVWLVACAPGAALYYFVLSGTDFMDVLTLAYVLFVTFIVHMLFTPAMVYCGALGASLGGALRYSILFLRKRHIHFIGLYIVFAVAWLFNFIPLVNLFTIFFFYPVAYAAMIAMAEATVKIEREEE